jgi:peptidoglycan/LPS O-acetylase OafA/YrhL
MGAEDRFDALLGNHSLAIAVKALFSTAVSVVVAVLSYELLEKRFLALKKFFEGRPGHAAAPGAADHLAGGETGASARKSRISSA